MGSIKSDSSDSDSSLNNRPIHEPLSCGDDEDGELEVFAPASANELKMPLPPEFEPRLNHVSSKMNRPPPPPQPYSTSLIDAMSASVASVENNEPFEMPAIISQSRPSTASSTTPNIEPEMFGIKYRPYGKVQTDYALPSKGVSDIDDHVDLINVSTAVISPSDDDDFDFETTNCPPTSTNQVPSVNVVALGAIREAQEAAEAIAIVRSLRADAASSDIVADGALTADIKRATMDALNAIKDVYDTGMGDFEINLLPVQDSVVEPVTAVSCGTIEEGDEEGEELQEELSVIRRKQNELEVSRLEAEWGMVGSNTNAINVQLSNPITTKVIENLVKTRRVKITYDEFLSFLQKQDLSMHRPAIVVRNPPKKATGIGSSVFNMIGLKKPAALNIPDAEEALVLPFLFAQIVYDPDISEHDAVLQTIFDTLISRAHFPRGLLGVPTTGPHWEQIGFQGLDPRTDINRSMKVFALLQALHLANIKTEECLRLHELSNIQSDTGGMDLSWPFMCVSILFTKEAIQALRNGTLNQIISERKNVLSVLHDFHHACFHDFAQRLNKDRTVHHALHLSAIRKVCESGGLEMLSTYLNYKHVDITIKQGEQEEIMSFEGIGEVQNIPN